MPHSPESHAHDHASGSGKARRPAARIPTSALGTGVATRLAIAGAAAGLLWLTVSWAIH